MSGMLMCFILISYPLLSNSELEFSCSLVRLSFPASISSCPTWISFVSYLHILFIFDWLFTDHILKFINDNTYFKKQSKITILIINEFLGSCLHSDIHLLILILPSHQTSRNSIVHYIFTLYLHPTYPALPIFNLTSCWNFFLWLSIMIPMAHPHSGSYFS